ncbi:MAG: twin-arginine translocation signal domain-containing protein, partial [Melioribacteraceae bacterium]
MGEKKSSGITRRKFIGNVTMTTAAFSIIPRHVLGGKGYVAPSDKLNIAIIGAGGKGKSDM